ncbi:MAG: hypothetical protein ACREX4_04045 [Gammaproteobacteria bacterium]
MKKLMLRALFVSILGAAAWPSAFAGGVSVSDPPEIAGTWLLAATALRRDGERTEENSEWNFSKDGRLLTTGYNYAADRVMTMEDSYKIVDGKIVTGQGGKYAVVEKGEKEMILKGPFGFYFFTRR